MAETWVVFILWDTVCVRVYTYVCVRACAHVLTIMCLCLGVVALENHGCSKFLNTGKPSFGLNGGRLEVHLVLGQRPFEAFES